MSENKSDNPQCALCDVKDKACRIENGTGPIFCPTKNKKETIKQAINEYEKPTVREFSRMASIQEAECYSDRDVKPYVPHPVKPRVQEICELAKKMSYKKLGIAFCAGLHNEAKALAEILNAQGFNVVSVVCKVGCTPKEAIGIRDNEKVRIGEFESMCSPIVQAMLLNEAETDFNILVGLCVGHDSLFFKYSKAYTTVLVAKDRVLAHNPAAALYTKDGYYARLLRPGIDVEKNRKL
ncbi:MAG: Metal-binding protein [Thermoproteota archaeon]|nr:Metal-binding protein [Thermoproteota archaeon]